MIGSLTITVKAGRDLCGPIQGEPEPATHEEGKAMSSPTAVREDGKRTGSRSNKKRKQRKRRGSSATGRRDSNASVASDASATLSPTGRSEEHTFPPEPPSTRVIVILAGVEVKRSKVVKNSADPEWDASFDFECDVSEEDAVTVTVFDVDSSTDIGYVKIPLRATLRSGKGGLSSYYDLSDDQGNRAGSIHLASKWTPKPQGPPEPGPAQAQAPPVDAPPTVEAAEAHQPPAPEPKYQAPEPPQQQQQQQQRAPQDDVGAPDAAAGTPTAPPPPPEEPKSDPEAEAAAGGPPTNGATPRLSLDHPDGSSKTVMNGHAPGAGPTGSYEQLLHTKWYYGKAKGACTYASTLPGLSRLAPVVQCTAERAIGMTALRTDPPHKALENLDGVVEDILEGVDVQIEYAVKEHVMPMMQQLAQSAGWCKAPPTQPVHTETETAGGAQAIPKQQPRGLVSSTAGFVYNAAWSVAGGATGLAKNMAISAMLMPIRAVGFGRNKKAPQDDKDGRQ